MITEFATFAKDYAWRISWAGAVLLVFELVMPASRSSFTSRIRAYGFWLVYITITATALTVFGKAFATLGIKPLLNIGLGSILSFKNETIRLFSLALAAIAANTLSDFFYYWFHRLQHTSLFMWRFHRVHHSIREMSAFNSNHHFTEEIFRIPFITIPLALLVTVSPGPTPFLVATLLGMHGLFIHSSTKLNFGPFRYIIADNRFHRIHHSIKAEHFDKNFGTFSVIWDLLFQTAYMPSRREWPATGIEEMTEPSSLKHFLFSPFTSQEPQQRDVNRKSN